MQENSTNLIAEKMMAFTFEWNGLTIKSIVRYEVDYMCRKATVRTTSVSIDGTLNRSLEKTPLINSAIREEILYQIDMHEFKPLEPA